MSNRRRTCSVGILAVCAAGLALERTSAGLQCAALGQAVGDPAEGQAVFTLTVLPDAGPVGCGGRPSGANLDTGAAATDFPARPWPLGLGAIRSTPNGSVIAAGEASTYYGWGCPWGAPEGFPAGYLPSIYVLTCPGGDVGLCTAMSSVRGAGFYVGIELMADEDTLLVSTAGGGVPCRPTAPFAVQKYSVSAIRPLAQEQGEWATHVLGPLLGVVESEDPVIAIVRDPDGRRAHLVTLGTELAAGRMGLHTIDVASMTELGTGIDLPELPPSASGFLLLLRASISADGGLLVVTRPREPIITVVDLLARHAAKVSVPDVVAVSDASFSHGGRNHGLLALSTHPTNDEVQVLTADLSPNAITIVGRGAITAWNLNPFDSPLEWTADGSGVVVSEGTGLGGPTVSLLEVEDAGRSITKVRNLAPCTGRLAFVVDVLTTKGHEPTPTSAPSPSPSPSRTPQPTPSPTGTATPPATATSTPTATATTTPSATRTPGPLYLPILLREHCAPRAQRVDVALVVDASTTMRDDHTATGRTKLAAAIEAAETFVAALALPLDQAAVVAFNRDAQVLQELTGDRAAIARALWRIPELVRLQTRIDLGIAEAHKELVSARHRPVNRRVMIVLTDGLANPEPVSTAVRRAQAAKDDGITVFAIGLGKDDELNVVELAEMASRAEYFYRAPDGEDLLAIYRSIAIELPCPGVRLWGRR